MSAKVIRLIETTELRGAGTALNPRRIVTRWWTFKGVLLFERDPLDKAKAEGDKL